MNKIKDILQETFIIHVTIHHSRYDDFALACSRILEELC